jgi:hypothetical protein
MIPHSCLNVLASAPLSRYSPRPRLNYAAPVRLSVTTPRLYCVVEVRARVPKGEAN